MTVTGTGRNARNGWITWRVIAVTLLAGGVAHWQGAAAQGTATVAIDVPAQSLASALNDLAVQTNQQMFFEQTLVQGQMSHALKGTMTADQALTALLADTRLQYRRNADGTVVISERPAVRAAAASARRARPQPAAVQPAEVAPVVPAAQAAPEWRPWALGARASYLSFTNRSDGFPWAGAPGGAVAGNGVTTNDQLGAELYAEYFLKPQLSVELALGVPQLHDLAVKGYAPGSASSRVGSFRVAPGFLTLKYYFREGERVQPYLGAGVNVTGFYGVNAAPYGLGRPTISAAAQGGISWHLNDRWDLTADLKYTHVRPEVLAGGVQRALATMDPMQFGLGLAYRLGRAGGGMQPAPVAALPPPPPAPPPAAEPAVVATPVVPVQPVQPVPPADDDQDGVPNDIDRCAATPHGLKVDAQGCEVEELVLKGVEFRTASADLDRKTLDSLDEAIAVLRRRAGSSAEIHGYTDDRGGDAYNLKLSEARAASVVDYLVAQGVPRANLRARGFGKADPVADNRTEEGRARNRRVTVQFMRPVEK
jgi:OOP family OmpA-OmpF porin